MLFTIRLSFVRMQLNAKALFFGRKLVYNLGFKNISGWAFVTPPHFEQGVLKQMLFEQKCIKSSFEENRFISISDIFMSPLPKFSIRQFSAKISEVILCF